VKSAGAMSETLILFARFPEPGKVKTRLIPSLGAEGAAREHRLMVEHALTQARAWRVLSGGRLCLAASGGSRWAWRAWLGNDFEFAAQSGEDLGERMHRAADRARRRGAQSVVIVGSDIPGLKPQHMRDAFKLLRKKDLVLGPASDGGYYLVGWKRAAPELFAGVAWGTGRARAQTKTNARRLRWSTAELALLPDVDSPRDLKHWARVRREGGAGVSVVIPVLNEAKDIAAAVAQARSAPRAEIVVVDGGSTDHTRAAAHRSGARVLSSPRGRASQLRAGARQARGSVLLFLHADTYLPAGYDISLREVLSRPGVVLGAFTLKVASPARRFRWVEALVGLRARSLGWPYGDQALFLTAAAYRRLRGFPLRPILEDVGLVERARALGRVAVAQAQVITSPRRWQQWGVLKTALVHQTVWLGYWAGLSLDRLARWYRGIR
jgi:uncharacterized protein